ncbi:MAG TPA: ribosome silencing factor [Acidimicrobiales bacterium]|nr:ribosome silencing factor [Acidimicrobiales bacterium]
MTTDLVTVAAGAASAKTMHPTVVLEVGDLLAITDYFVISSGRNDRQVRAIAEEVERKVKDSGGVSPRAVEGLDDARWILMDFGDFVVHVFDEEAREFYDLEHLWSDAPRLAWEDRELTADRA